MDLYQVPVTQESLSYFSDDVLEYMEDVSSFTAGAILFYATENFEAYESMKYEMELSVILTELGIRKAYSEEYAELIGEYIKDYIVLEHFENFLKLYLTKFSKYYSLDDYISERENIIYECSPEDGVFVGMTTIKRITCELSFLNEKFVTDVLLPLEKICLWYCIQPLYNLQYGLRFEDLDDIVLTTDFNHALYLCNNPIYKHQVGIAIFDFDILEELPELEIILKPSDTIRRAQTLSPIRENVYEGNYSSASPLYKNVYEDRDNLAYVMKEIEGYSNIYFKDLYSNMELTLDHITTDNSNGDDWLRQKTIGLILVCK
jgi:hypothetical protein